MIFIETVQYSVLLDRTEYFHITHNFHIESQGPKRFLRFFISLVLSNTQRDLHKINKNSAEKVMIGQEIVPILPATPSMMHKNVIILCRKKKG